MFVIIVVIYGDNMFMNFILLQKLKKIDFFDFTKSKKGERGSIF